MKSNRFLPSLMTSMLVLTAQSPLAIASSQSAETGHILASKYHSLCTTKKISNSTKEKLSAFIENSQTQFETTIQSDEFDTSTLSNEEIVDLNLVQFLYEDTPASNIGRNHLKQEATNIQQAQSCDSLLPIMERMHKDNMSRLNKLFIGTNLMANKYKALCDKENISNSTNKKASALEEQIQNEFESLIDSKGIGALPIPSSIIADLNLVNLLNHSDAPYSKINQRHLQRESSALRQAQTCEDLLPIVEDIHERNIAILNIISDYGLAIDSSTVQPMNDLNPKNIAACKSLIYNKPITDKFNNLFMDTETNQATADYVAIHTAWVISNYKKAGLNAQILNSETLKDLVYQYIAALSQNNNCEDQVQKEALAIKSIQALDTKITERLNPKNTWLGMWAEVFVAALSSNNDEETQKKDNATGEATTTKEKTDSTTDLLAEIIKESLKRDTNKEVRGSN